MSTQAPDEKPEYSANYISYCGLFCPKCFNMVVSEAASNLEKALNNTHICGSPFDPSEKFKVELKALINLRCSVFCKDKKESDCTIRSCCIDRKVEGCWECIDVQGCPMLTQQFRENCEMISKRGFKEFINEYSPFIQAG